MNLILNYYKIHAEVPSLIVLPSSHQIIYKKYHSCLLYYFHILKHGGMRRISVLPHLTEHTTIVYILNIYSMILPIN